MILADAVNRAHDQLVQMSSEKKIRLEAKRHEQDVPDKFTALLTDHQVLAHLLDCVCSNLLDPVKEHLELGESLFLCLLPGMFLGKSLLLLLLHLILLKRRHLLWLDLAFFVTLKAQLLFKVVVCDDALELLDHDCILLPDQVEGEMALDVKKMLPQLPRQVRIQRDECLER